MRLLKFYQSSIGKKYVVAISGGGLFLFLIAHMLGNMWVYGGAAEIDSYSHHLRTFMEDFFGFGGFLWVARIGLLVFLIAHVVTIILLTRQNRKAKPRYQHRHRSARTLASMTMMISGPLILIYVILHILQFTTGTVRPTSYEEGAVYSNLWHAFQVWWIALVYVVMMGFICLHLYHGVWSMFQSLGINNQDRNHSLRLISTISALVIFLGFSSVPTLIWSGVLPAPVAIESTHQTVIGQSDTLIAQTEGEQYEP